jgi:hypothetical protein
VSASGTTCIEIGSRFTTRVSASGITDIEIEPRFTAEADTLELNLDLISISVVPELTP